MASQEKSREIQRIAENVGVKVSYLTSLESLGVQVGDLEFVVETLHALVSDPERERQIGASIAAHVWRECAKDEDVFEEIVDLAFDIEKGPASQRLLQATAMRLGTVLEIEADAASIDMYDDESSPDFAREKEEQSAIEK